MLESLRARKQSTDCRGERVAGAGIASALDGLVDAEAADERQKAEDAGGARGLEQFGTVGVEGHGLGRTEGGRAGRGARGPGAAREAGEALVVEDLADLAFAGGRLGGGIETGLDVGNGEIELAEADDFVVGGGGEGARGRAAGLGGAEEEVGGFGEGAEVADDGVDGVAGAVEAAGDLEGGELFDEEGTEDFVAPLARIGGLDEERAGMGKVSRGRVSHVRHNIACD